jgi:central kinetochore subunit Mis15/CHL4
MAPSRAPPRPTNIALPSFEPLPSSLRLPPTHPTVTKTLSPLSRPTLLKLAAEWCSPAHLPACGPYVNEHDEPDDPDNPWSAATSIDELRELYAALASRRGSKRELLDRVLEGDWRRGVSLRQLAMADAAHLAEHPSSRRWVAYAISHPASSSGGGGGGRAARPPPPRVHPSAFLLALHAELAPLAKAHYHTSRPAALPLTVVRASLFATPYSPSPSEAAATADQAMLASPPRTLLLAFPDAAPFVYVSFPAAAPPSTRRSAGGGDDPMAVASTETAAASLDAFVLAALPAALSRPGRPRCTVTPAALTARSLSAMLAMRGAQAASGAGAFSLVAAQDCVPAALDFGQRGGVDDVVRKAGAESDDGEDEDVEEEQDGEKDAVAGAAKKGRGKVGRRPAAAKRGFEHADPTAALPAAKRRALRKVAAARFGTAGAISDGGEAEAAGLDRVSVRLRDGFGEGKLDVRINFVGSHVFAGVRRLVEAGVVDGGRMPTWLTGEANSSMGVVEGGQMKAWDGLVD